jgi:twitching motility protein PilJ
MTAQSAKARNAEQDRTPAIAGVALSALNAPIARRSKKRLGIRVKATALAAVFGVLPVLVVGGIAYWVAERSIVQKIAQEKITESAQLSDRLSRFLEDRIANLKTVVRVAELTGEANFSSGAPRTKERAVALQKLEKELSNFTQDYPVYSNISVYDLQGNPIVRSAGSARELNQKNFPYFQKVLQKGIPVISEPIATEVGDARHWAIYIGAPIKNDAQQVSAAIVAKIPVEFVGNAILRTSGLSENTTYRLIDSSGQIFQNLNEQDEQQNTPIGTKIATKTLLFEGVNAQRRNQAWIDSGSWGEQLYAYSPVLNVSGLSWSVVTATDSTIAFAPQRNLLQTIGIGTVLTALVTAVLGAFIANRVTLPILQATAAVEKIGEGNLDIRVPVRGNDELAVLGDNINHMAGQIQNLLGTLRQNADRLSLQNQVLAELARNEGISLGNAKIAAHAFTKATAETLEVELVSIWLYNSDRSGLVCLDLYERTPKQHSDGMELKVVDFPGYFQSLDRDPFIVANDVSTHPAMQEFSASYLTPLGIQSRLDTPIQITAQTVGIVCCEQVGSPRQWTPEEQTFVGSIANLVALALENETTQEEVGHLLDIVSSVEEGDLTARANVSDRATGLVADTFNRLLEQLGQVLAQVSGTAQQVTQTSRQLDESSKTVALNAQQQAEGAAKVLNLTKRVQSSARHSANQIALANQSLGEVRTTIEQGQLAIDTLRAFGRYKRELNGSCGEPKTWMSS